uniref:WW domain-binding protein 11 n=1 Tax=Mandrillus leucophaeus TaxID=9568 RepID=A0A2K5Z260_MANLE
MGRKRSKMETFMNPIDQARKEARKGELKNSKKKRMMFPAAKQDEMEFNPKVLKDKCKKLHETFGILRLDEKENPDIYKELGKLEVEYKQKRVRLSQYFDVVKNALHVEMESIPLSDMPYVPSNILIQDISLPGAQPPSILKKTQPNGPPTRTFSILAFLGHGVPRLPHNRKPLCPLSGPPPPEVVQMYGRKVDEDMLYSPALAQSGHGDDVSSTSEDDSYPEDKDQDKHDESIDDSDTDRSDGKSDRDAFVHRDDGERDNNEEKKSGSSVQFANMPGKSRKKKKNMKELTPLQAMMLPMAGQEIPEEGWEVEEFSEDDDEDDSDDSEAEKQSQKQNKEESHADGTSTQQPPLQSVQAPPMPGQPPLGPPPALPLWPPGPPTGLPAGPPPRALPFLRPSEMPGLQGPSLAEPWGFLSAPPNLIQQPNADDMSTATIEKKGTATISTKSQINNTKAEITLFLPTALRVHWENNGATAAPQRKSEDDSAVPLAKAAPKSGPAVPVSVQTKDDVYEVFMKEIEGLL